MYVNVVKTGAHRESNVRFINTECVTEWLMAQLSVLTLIIDSKTKIRNVQYRSRERLGNGKYSSRV